jgi:hypothetical protein
MDLEDFHHRARYVIDEDDARLLPALHPETEEEDLHSERCEKEKVVAMKPPIRLPYEFRRDHQPQHDACEQAGPGLLQPEQDEFGQPPGQPRQPAAQAPAEWFEIGAGFVWRQVFGCHSVALVPGPAPSMPFFEPILRLENVLAQGNQRTADEKDLDC